MWLQLGGHSDGDPDTAAVAKREAEEESGLPVTLVSAEIFDIDVHAIPARKDDPEHEHFDVRFQLLAERDDFVVSAESIDLAWVPLVDLQQYTDEESILRMKMVGPVKSLNLRKSQRCLTNLAQLCLVTGSGIP